MSDATLSGGDWPAPPSWGRVSPALRQTLGHRVLRRCRHVLFLATGGWIHAARIAGHGAAHLSALDSLDPRVVAHTLRQAGPPDSLAVIAVSESRQTFETRALVGTVAAHLRAAGRDPRDHVLWLSRCSAPVAGNSLDDDGLDRVDLELGGSETSGALFAAPSSLPFLLALALAHGEDTARALYGQFLARRGPWVGAAESAASRLELAGDGRPIYLRLGGGPPPAAVRFVLQLLRQSLGSKGLDPQPALLAGVDGAPVNAQSIDLDASSGKVCRPLVRTMLQLDAAQHLIAALGWRWRLPFTTHDQVRRYKRRLPAWRSRLAPLPRAGAGPELDVEGLARHVRTWLTATAPPFVELVVYGRLGRTTRDRLTRRLAAAGRRVTVFNGSEWNHHSFQAAVTERSTRYVLVDPWWAVPQVEGLAAEATAGLVEALRALARATHDCLIERSRFWCPIEGAG